MVATTTTTTRRFLLFNSLLLLLLLLLTTTTTTFARRLHESKAEAEAEEIVEGSELDQDVETADEQQPSSQEEGGGKLIRFDVGMLDGEDLPTTGSFVVSSQEEGGGKLIRFDVGMLDGEDLPTTGSFVVRTRPDWAPIGVERFEELATVNFWEGCRIFRVLPNFVSQFGINGDPSVQSRWMKNLEDDEVKTSNVRGTVTFATAGPGTRTTQIFINTADNEFLDGMGFSPIGEVVSGMDIVDRFYSGYGEGAPSGNGPAQYKIQSEGNSYLEKDFPLLSYFLTSSFV
eukprot:CAMPEP_0185740966 /NCGR_PEP_ID=MMETSP1171-20130828/38705_1 /TAXON_ID=374046 /ORGANISM="Helicotheca tamensis, Strain CCMP826" /LENGTH=286 /DNA_ID=CAMNT_0028412903 /DNA_START=91 /DNA_END=951 /DNA_ORIENTATION=+